MLRCCSRNSFYADVADANNQQNRCEKKSGKEREGSDASWLCRHISRAANALCPCINSRGTVQLTEVVNSRPEGSSLEQRSSIYSIPEHAQNASSNNENIGGLVKYLQGEETVQDDKPTEGQSNQGNVYDNKAYLPDKNERLI